MNRAKRKKTKSNRKEKTSPDRDTNTEKKFVQQIQPLQLQKYAAKTLTAIMVKEIETYKK